jgi:hypothetical protein
VGPSRKNQAVSAGPLWRGRLFISVRVSWSLPSPFVVLFSVGAWYLIRPDALTCRKAAEPRSQAYLVRCAAGHCSAPRGGCVVVPRSPRAYGVGIEPHLRNAFCTVTEVTELSFRRKYNNS